MTLKDPSPGTAHVCSNHIQLWNQGFIETIPETFRTRSLHIHPPYGLMGVPEELSRPGSQNHPQILTIPQLSGLTLKLSGTTTKLSHMG